MAFAAANPALVRSDNRERSYSARDGNMSKISFPCALVVSSQSFGSRFPYGTAPSRGLTTSVPRIPRALRCRRGHRNREASGGDNDHRSSTVNGLATLRGFSGKRLELK